MRPDHPKSFDPHEPIDLADPAHVSLLIERFDTTHDELTQPVEKVGTKPVAGAIFLGRADAVWAATAMR